jgi:hypothetical protein
MHYLFAFVGLWRITITIRYRRVLGLILHYSNIQEPIQVDVITPAH